jgi:3-hydroxyacyl-CoA dehydrogenase
MTAADLAELERLLADYQKACKPEHSRQAMATARRRLETALVHHADELIERAEIVQDVRDNGFRNIPAFGPVMRWR